MTLPRLCRCSDAIPQQRCPPDCTRGEIEPFPRDENGRALPDSNWTPDELAALHEARRIPGRNVKLTVEG
jgi:hypothetical protein